MFEKFIADSKKVATFAVPLVKTREEDSLAQLVEHNTFNVGVSGSSPERVTIEASLLQEKYQHS